MARLDKEDVRAARRLEDVIPALTGHAVDIGTGAECVTLCPFHEDTHPPCE